MKQLFDLYICLVPTYRGGTYYEVGDRFEQVAGTNHPGSHFELVSKSDVPVSELSDEVIKPIGTQKKQQAKGRKDS